MKLSIDERPDQQGFLFRADTHDRHICPAPGSKDHEICELMEKNQQLAQSIETTWQDGGLPTFKTYLNRSGTATAEPPAIPDQAADQTPAHDPGGR